MPLGIGGFPAPDAGDDLLGRRGSPFCFVEQTVPAGIGVAGRVAPDPPDAVVHGELGGFVEADLVSDERSEGGDACAEGESEEGDFWFHSWGRAGV